MKDPRSENEKCCLQWQQLTRPADFIPHNEIERVNLRGQKLREFNLESLNFNGAYLNGVDFRHSRLNDAHLIESFCAGAIFTGANLSGANFKGAGLYTADFSGANLTDSVLTGVDLRFVRGNGLEIKSMNVDKWIIVWTSDVLAIGCQQHSIEKWRKASNRWITTLDIDALKWWKKYRDFVFSAIDTFPATGKVLDTSENI